MPGSKLIQTNLKMNFHNLPIAFKKKTEKAEFFPQKKEMKKNFSVIFFLGVSESLHSVSKKIRLDFHQSKFILNLMTSKFNAKRRTLLKMASKWDSADTFYVLRLDWIFYLLTKSRLTILYLVQYRSIIQAYILRSLWFADLDIDHGMA